MSLPLIPQPKFKLDERVIINANSETRLSAFSGRIMTVKQRGYCLDTMQYKYVLSMFDQRNEDVVTLSASEVYLERFLPPDDTKEKALLLPILPQNFSDQMANELIRDSLVESLSETTNQNMPVTVAPSNN